MVTLVGRGRGRDCETAPARGRQLHDFYFFLLLLLLLLFRAPQPQPQRVVHSALTVSHALSLAPSCRLARARDGWTGRAAASFVRVPVRHAAVPSAGDHPISYHTRTRKHGEAPVSFSYASRRNHLLLFVIIIVAVVVVPEIRRPLSPGTLSVFRAFHQWDTPTLQLVPVCVCVPIDQPESCRMIMLRSVDGPSRDSQVKTEKRNGLV